MEWTKIEDGLPEYSGRYLTINKGTMCIFFYNELDQRFYSVESCFAINDTSHWANLPDPPEKD